jgi:predicted RNA-binding Zn-ribbon protein involved in translation (DUF1610 family)
MKAFNSTFNAPTKPMKRSATRIKPDSARLTIKQRKCAICKKPFTPFSGLVRWCSPDCGAELALRKLEQKAKSARKQERADDRRRKEALMNLSDWLAAFQIVFNKYIRTRDADKTCIDCGKPFEPQKLGGSMDAGHYLSRGSAPHLRFDERNVHGQRKNCNRPGGATREAFRAGMEKRIGREALEALESDQESREWTIPDIKAQMAFYRAKTKELLAQSAERE